MPPCPPGLRQSEMHPLHPAVTMRVKGPVALDNWVCAWGMGSEAGGGGGGEARDARVRVQAGAGCGVRGCGVRGARCEDVI